MFGTVPATGLGLKAVAELLGELRCAVDWAEDGTAVWCGEPPLHAAVKNTRTAIHIRICRFLCRNR